MPTPFYHLSLAESLLNYPELPYGVRHFLQSVRCEFMFGNTAPDVQVVSGQPRQVTHFFNLPIPANAIPAWELMMSQYPAIARAGELALEQAAFIAGYLCHLQADWVWVKDIFAPTFGPLCLWGTFHERLYLHNVLRAYLDKRILPELCAGIDICLSQVQPDGWLPYVEDRYLMEWRDLLFPQLRPGALTYTVEVFSSRDGRSAPDFYALLDSEERMQQEVFEHLPLQQVQLYHQRVLQQNSNLLTNYLAFTLHHAKAAVEGDVNSGAQP